MGSDQTDGYRQEKGCAVIRVVKKNAEYVPATN